LFAEGGGHAPEPKESRMRMTRSFAPRLLSFIALGVLASPAVAGGCGGNSNVTPQKSGTGGSSGTGGATAGRGGTSGSASGGTGNRGGTGGKGAQGGTMNIDDGGEAGESTGGTGGATGGAGGKAMGGTGGRAGAAGVGGTAGMSAGTAGGPQGGTAGQSGGTAGQSGAAGNGTAGMVGVLGTQCSPPGALACAGNHQKLTVLCGGNGTWEPNQTCGADLYCDSTPGPTVGLCAPVAEGCDAGPGTVFCTADEKRIVTCGPDAVTRSEMTCDGACHRGVCRDDRDPCPDWDQYDDGTACAKDCGEPEGLVVGTCSVGSGRCYRSFNVFAPAVARTPWSDDVCACEMVEGRTLRIGLISSGYERITVPPPWRIGSCGEEGQQCAVGEYLALDIWTPALDAGPVNIVVEAVNSGATCPQ
jgi:hypothetical protein